MISGGRLFFSSSVKDVTSWLFLEVYAHMCEEEDGLKLELTFKKEAEHKSLKNVQPDHVVEKENPLPGEKFKLAAEICISNEEPNVSHKGENVCRAYHRPSQQPLPSQAQRPRRQKWFPGLSSWNPLLCVA